jgi:hypothetical protein
MFVDDTQNEALYERNLTEGFEAVMSGAIRDGRYEDAMRALDEIDSVKDGMLDEYRKLKKYTKMRSTMRDRISTGVKQAIESDSRSIKSNQELIGDQADTNKRRRSILANQEIIRRNSAVQDLAPGKDRLKLENLQLEVAGRNAVNFVSPSAKDLSTEITDSEMDKIYKVAANSLSVQELNQSSKDTIAIHARKYKEELAAKNSEIMKYDSFTVYKSEEPLQNALKSEKNLRQAIITQKANGTMKPFKVQVARHSKKGRSTLNLARVDDVYAGNKIRLTETNYPTMNQKTRSLHKKKFPSDATDKTWKDIEKKWNRDKGSIAKAFDEKLPNGEFKYPMYANMYRDMVESRHYYYMAVAKTEQGAEKALQMAHKDVNEYLESTYKNFGGSFIDGEVGVVIKSQSSVNTKVGGFLGFMQSTEQKYHEGAITNLKRTIKERPQDFFDAPEGYNWDEVELKFVPGLATAEELAPRISVDNGKTWIRPWSKGGEKDGTFFNADREYIKQWRLMRKN